ncbi:MAG TPA: DUF192 domain-containing protein [Burkholderiales bacterium]|nr:DUF192 domain-containing protein [Burkholderiales bacterium]
MDILRFRRLGFVFLVFFVFFAATHLGTPGRADPLLTFPLRIQGQEIRAEVANTPESRRQGLMFRPSLPDAAGMVFVFPEAGRHAMWMKDTTVPLSVAFIDGHGRILNIEDMAPYSEDTHQSAGPARYALEVNRGWFARHGIKPGARVEGLGRLPPAQ